jgi:CDP-paratose 2-epimerase
MSLNKKFVLITGSDGLIGSEAVKHFSQKGFRVLGIDNNSRKKFFGEEASVLWKRKYLKKNIKNYIHFHQDITNKIQMEKIFKEYGKKIDLIIHAAAQPSHDWAATNPRLDYAVNAVGTLNLLECFRQFSPEATFIFTSTNKVYGDNPNKLKFEEGKSRYKIKKGTSYENGIDENMSIDNTLHSVFGASKTSADILVQEYGKYFNLNTVCFRGGCLTGPSHSGTSLHGFLSYLVKCTLSEAEYTIYGYKGKQVRDNIHSLDLIKAFDEFHKKPKKGEVYNIGGGTDSNCSMVEAINIIEEISGKNLKYKYTDKARIGDHKWYVSDLTKFKTHFPNWKITYDINSIIEEIYIENKTRWAKA